MVAITTTNENLGIYTSDNGIRRTLAMVRLLLGGILILWVLGLGILTFSSTEIPSPAGSAADTSFALAPVQDKSSLLESNAKNNVSGEGESTSHVGGWQCPIKSISALSEEVIHPKVGSRHMVEPPHEGKLTLVCCETTKGSFSALLHHVWAPIGVARLVEMIRSGYFASKIPLFRCTDACQFGLSSDSNQTKLYNSRLQDDPNWMPPGPSNRQNEAGVKRYPQGFWTYAGGGPNTRGNQFVITLKPNQFMGGGSPWEVPLGELVGEESFALLPNIYTGYGEKGPGQGLLHREGITEESRQTWPLMDYILDCAILDELEQ